MKIEIVPRRSSKVPKSDRKKSKNFCPEKKNNGRRKFNESRTPQSPGWARRKSWTSCRNDAPIVRKEIAGFVGGKNFLFSFCCRIFFIGGGGRRARIPPKILTVTRILLVLIVPVPVLAPFVDLLRLVLLMDSIKFRRSKWPNATMAVNKIDFFSLRIFRIFFYLRFPI